MIVDKLYEEYYKHLKIIGNWSWIENDGVDREKEGFCDCPDDKICNIRRRNILEDIKLLEKD